MTEIIDSIEWVVVAVVMLAFVGIALVLVSLTLAVFYENAWPLLILLPAGVCISLAVGMSDF